MLKGVCDDDENFVSVGLEDGSVSLPWPVGCVSANSALTHATESAALWRSNSTFKPLSLNGICTRWDTTFAKNYAPQTKILEGLTKEEMRLFEALFKGVSTRFWLRTIESPFENQELIFCSFFQNLRLGSMEIGFK